MDGRTDGWGVEPSLETIQKPVTCGWTNKRIVAWTDGRKLKEKNSETGAAGMYGWTDGWAIASSSAKKQLGVDGWRNG